MTVKRVNKLIFDKKTDIDRIEQVIVTYKATANPGYNVSRALVAEDGKRGVPYPDERSLRALQKEIK